MAHHRSEAELAHLANTLAESLEQKYPGEAFQAAMEQVKQELEALTSMQAAAVSIQIFESLQSWERTECARSFRRNCCQIATLPVFQAQDQFIHERR